MLMGILKATTTIGTAAAVIYESVTEKGEFSDEKAKKRLTTSLVATGTTMASNSFLDLKNAQNHREYANSTAEYIESLSDEELAQRLQELNLLEENMFSGENSKSL